MGFLRERRRQAPLCCRHAAATASRSHFFFPPQAQIFLSFSLCVSFLMLWLFWLFLLLQHHSFPLLELSLTLFIFFWMVQLDVTAALKYPPSFTITFTSSTAVCLFQIFLIILSTFPFIAQLAFSTTFFLSVTPSFSYPSFFSPSHLHPEEGGDAGRVNA